MFDNPEPYRELIEIIAQQRAGISRAGIAAASQHSTIGGQLSERLTYLIEAEFIEESRPWRKKIGAYYKVVDEFCLFAAWWLVGRQTTFFDDYWELQQEKPAYAQWAKYAFDAVCSKHFHQIMCGLKIKHWDGSGDWRFPASSDMGDEAQIDILLRKHDGSFTLCETHYSEEPLVIDAKYAEKLNQKVLTFKKQMKTESPIYLSMITAYGVQKNKYSDELIRSVSTMKDLFRLRDK
jgi:hypothetical protein